MLNNENSIAGVPEVFGRQCYQNLARLSDSCELNAKILASLNDFGFTDFSCHRLGSHQSLATHAMTVIGHPKDDMMLNHIRCIGTPIFMSTLERHITDSPIENQLYKNNYELIRSYKCNGFYNLYSTSVKPSNDLQRLVLSVASHGMNSDDFVRRVNQYRRELYWLAKAIDDAVAHNFPKLFEMKAKQIRINARPLELLTVIARDNLQLKQAAAKVCISVDTANKHMATVKQALGASTQAAAVYRAIKAGLINTRD